MSIEIFPNKNWNPSYWEGPRRDIAFEDFTPFINHEGLTPDEYLKLRESLESYYNASTKYHVAIPGGIDMPTGKIWTPGMCMSTVFTDRLLEESLDAEAAKVRVVECTEPGFDHRWLEVDIDNSSPIIVDSSGLVPTQSLIDEGERLAEKDGWRAMPGPFYVRDRYIPYFGRKDKVPFDIHNIVYSAGTSMNDTRLEEARNQIFKLERASRRPARSMFSADGERFP